MFLFLFFGFLQCLFGPQTACKAPSSCSSLSRRTRERDPLFWRGSLPSLLSVIFRLGLPFPSLTGFSRKRRDRERLRHVCFSNAEVSSGSSLRRVFFFLFFSFPYFSATAAQRHLNICSCLAFKSQTGCRLETPPPLCLQGVR